MSELKGKGKILVQLREGEIIKSFCAITSFHSSVLAVNVSFTSLIDFPISHQHSHLSGCRKENDVICK